jgi:hypothetical protein
MSHARGIAPLREEDGKGHELNVVWEECSMRRDPTARTTVRMTTALLAASLLLTACRGEDAATGATGEAAEGEVVTLVWQMWANNEAEVRALNQLAELVHEEHDHIQLEIQSTPFDDYWTRIAAQASGGNVGCILGVQAPRGAQITELLLDLDDELLASVGIDLDDYDPAIVEALQALATAMQLRMPTRVSMSILATGSKPNLVLSLPSVSTISALMPAVAATAATASSGSGSAIPSRPGR